MSQKPKKTEPKKPTIEEISSGLTSVCAQGIDHAKGYGNSAIARYMAKLCISIHRHHEMMMEQVKKLQAEHWKMYAEKMEEAEEKRIREESKNAH